MRANKKGSVKTPSPAVIRRKMVKIDLSFEFTVAY